MPSTARTDFEMASMSVTKIVGCLLIFFMCTATVTGTVIIHRTSRMLHQSSCGSWAPYTNEKCLHIVDSAVFQTKEEAGVVCQSLAEVMELDDIPRVVTVRNENEQKVLQKYLFEEVGLLEPVWLGLDREDDGVFRWNNGADTDFNNLAKQNVSDADKPCVQMESGEGIYPMGQWVRVNCRKRNVVVCEKIQVWTVAKLQNNLLNLRSEVAKQKAQVKELVAPPQDMSPKSISCGDWVPFKDEKCVKLMDKIGTQTKEDADHICQSLTDGSDMEQMPKLVKIKTEEKQKFVQKLLYGNRATFDSVWLGLENERNSLFKWNDGTEMFFTNWAEQSGVDNNEQQCVQMESGVGFYKVGQWVRTNCKKRNAVVCEKTQVWTVTRLQNILLSLKLNFERNQKEWEEKNKATKQEADSKMAASKQEMDRKLNSLKQEMEQKVNAVKQEAERRLNDYKKEAEHKIVSNKQEAEHKINAVKVEAERKINVNKVESEGKMNAIKQESDKKIKETESKINAVKHESDQKINNLVKNPVPIGFTYVQFPDQSQPSSIWPQTTWKDITSSYAGLFFRAAGGNAGAFGQIQEENSPRLANVEWLQNGNGGGYTKRLHTVPANGGWSEYVFSGDLDGKKDMYMRFKLSTGEVRPRNKAIIIWKRIA